MSTIIPISLLATSVLYLLHRLLPNTTRLTTPYLRDSSIPLPPSIRTNPVKYILHHETVCKTLPCARLPVAAAAERGKETETETETETEEERKETDILTLFLGHSMSTFSSSPTWLGDVASPPLPRR